MILDLYYYPFAEYMTHYHSKSTYRLYTMHRVRTSIKAITSYNALENTCSNYNNSRTSSTYNKYE